MSDPSLFGILILDREPFVFADLPGLLQAWLQNAGGYVFAMVVVYLLVALQAAIRVPEGQAESNRERTAVPKTMLACAVLALFCYLAYGGMMVANIGGPSPEVLAARAKRDAEPYAFVKQEAPKVAKDLQSTVLTLAGLFAIIAAAAPLASTAGRLRFRRIWALARLAMIEAVRKRTVWVFLLFFLPIFFPVDWFLTTKDENQLRMRVTSINLFVQVLALLVAITTASFAIPADVKSQNIYTVITKPVVRFEIVLGWFLGYACLLTVAIACMTLAGLVFIETGKVNPKSDEETFTARVPVRGQLKFQSRKGEMEGTDVGREFGYRKYIAGDTLSPQRAVWSFTRLPSSLASATDDIVPCEFTFDIFRLTKGEENRGVDVNIRVTTWQCGQDPSQNLQDGIWKWRDPDQEAQYKAEAKKLLDAIPTYRGREFDVFSVLGGTPKDDPNWPAIWQVANTLAAKYGFFEIPTKEVYDYHPERVILPAGLFRKAAIGTPPNGPDGNPEPRLRIYVKCTSRSQMLGMAEPDLFLMEDTQPFWQNYIKASFGTWCRVILVLGLAICLSTYLAGVIGFLVTAFLFITGFFSDYLAELASTRSSGSGPFSSLNQLLQAKQSTMPDDGSATSRAAMASDSVHSWLVRRFIKLVPDVDAYSWTNFVSEGFNIPIECLFMNFLSVLAYLIPWFLLGFYLMRAREVAA